MRFLSIIKDTCNCIVYSNYFLFHFMSLFGNNFYFHKVAKWRQDCLARQEEEEAMAARHMSELRAALEEDEKREREKRNMIKEQLEQFHSEQEGLKRKRMECERERIQTHKERMQKQLLVDKER